ncbi:MAG TPA: XrtA/PEP-CTERM system TPR-repeat protein PrsT [Stellaceae bacterium]|nr:XrtA/PEP-CTERM system TPR-repeat protein PrsT [Stellaceae bacterium]
MRDGFLKAGVALVALCGFVATAHAADYLGNAKAFLAKGDLKSAEIELKNAVRANPREMQAHSLLARVELQLGKPAAAEQQAREARAGGFDLDHTVPFLAETYLAQHKYRELLQDFPVASGSTAERAGVLVARGYAESALGNPDEAEKSFQEAQGLAPRAPQPLLAEAKLLITERNYPAAEKKLDHALGLDAKSPEIRLAKAQLLRVTGRLAPALTLTDQILSDVPGFLPARLERAELLLAQGKDDPARKEVAAVLAAQPGNIEAIYLQAVLLANSKDYKAADADLVRISGAIAAFPGGYYLQAVVKYNLRQITQAEDAARRYVARQPDSIAGKKLLALIELAQNRPADAVAALSGIERSGKADASVYDLMGRAYTQLGKSAQASAAFAQAVKRAPDNPALRLQLGESRLRSGDAADAIAQLEQSLALAPSIPAGEMLAMTELSSGQWQHAVATADKLQKAQPDSPAADNLQGVIKLTRFDLAGARAIFARIVEKHPDFMPARLNLAQVAELQGNLGEAERILGDALARQPGNGEVLTALVNLLLQQGQSERALAAAEQAHQAAPTDKGITAGLINLYIRLGQNDKALLLARQEPGSNEPDNVPLIAARVRAELAAGRKNDAAQSLRRLVAIDPAKIAPQRELAAVLLSAGDTAGARRAIDAAIKTAPHDPQVIAERIAIDLKTEGLATALATAAQLQKSDPGLPTSPALPGDVYMMARQYAKAAEAYQAALRQAPSTLLVVRLARAKAAAGQPDAADALLRDWLKQHPDDVAIGQIVASNDIAAHRFAEATRELERVIAKAPRDALALNNLAWLYQQAGDPRARSLAERAYLLAPSLPQTADTLGWILVQQGQAANALALLQRAHARQPANPAVQYHLAVALKDAGHPTEARKLLAPLVNSTAKFDDKGAAEKLLAALPKP